MTTIYVNHELGVAMTDTRTTTTYDYVIFGCIKVGEHETFNDNTYKAIHVHDRLFIQSGDCGESTKTLQYLIDGTPIVPAPKKQKKSSVCFYVDKNWLLVFTLSKGKVQKKFYALSPDAWYSTGSGGDALSSALEKYNFKPTFEEAISAFKMVSKTDQYTSDKINIYNI